MTVSPGRLIAFEGLDQSGKETQAARLDAWLVSRGHRVERLAFPDYTTPIALEIARTLEGSRDYSPDVLQLLYIANRFEYKARILEWMAAGAIVLCDRYLASSLAYGTAQGLDLAWLKAVQEPLPQPHLTVLLDIAPATALARKATGRDRFEQDLALLARVRATYLELAAGEGWCRIDGELERDVVSAQVIESAAAVLALP